MKTEHAAQTQIAYGSRYGSAEHDARKLAERTGFPVLPYREVNGLSHCPRVIPS